MSESDMTMSAAPFIDPDEEVTKGEDFYFLKETGIARIQALSGEIWTDYNEHDPGVTTLEQLCYALTDLTYRANYSVLDLLTSSDSRFRPHRHGMFIAKRILPCNPVTSDDYRKLLIDRVSAVRNVWLVPVESNENEQIVAGQYDIRIYVPENQRSSLIDDEQHWSLTSQKVRECYLRHRGLCEDVRNIQVLQPLEVRIDTMSVGITGQVTPEAAMADVLYRMGLSIAPEPKRTSLKECLDEGATSDEIFNGPLLVNGFIDGSQLGEQPTEVAVRKITGSLIKNDQIVRVSDVRLSVEDETYGEYGVIKIDSSSILSLSVSEAFHSIRLYQNGVEVFPSLNRTLRELGFKWSAHRKDYPLANQYNEYFGLGSGTVREVEKYYSVQNQYPNVYGINANGLGNNPGQKRRAQARQLKGYLLVFEQLLANCLAQIAHIRDLYSINPQVDATYYYQSLLEDVPDVDPLVDNATYERDLARIVESQDPFLERRNRFLSFLLSLYGEELSSDAIWTVAESDQGAQAGRTLLKAKLTFLHNLIISTHNRSKGFNYLARPSHDNVAGLVIKSRIQLGMPSFLRMGDGESDDSDHYPGPFTSLPEHREHIDAMFASVPEDVEVSANREFLSSEEVEELFATPERLDGDLLDAASHPQNYRYGFLPGDDQYSIVLFVTGKGWVLIRHCASESELSHYVDCFIRCAKECCHHRQELYVVEHNLLRYARDRDHDKTALCGEDLIDEDEASLDLDSYSRHHHHPHHRHHHHHHHHHHHRHHHHHHYPFEYDFTITVVVITTPENRRNPDYRAFVHRVIRENTPSHIAIDYCFPTHHQAQHFKSLFDDWQGALRERRYERELVNLSAKLRDFLYRHKNRRRVHDEEGDDG